MDIQSAAKTLYDNGHTLQDISDVLGKSRNTISKWSSKGNWRKKRADQLLRQHTSQERIWHLIDHQLMIIERIIEKKAEEINNKSDLSDLKSALIERGDIDALQKLHTTIKGKEMEWHQVVKIIRELVDYLEAEDIKLAKALHPLANQFLSQKRDIN